MDIYLLIEGKQEGPFTEEGTRQSLAEGLIPADLPAWREGLSDWIPVNALCGHPKTLAIAAVDTGSQPVTSPKVPVEPQLTEWFYNKKGKRLGPVAESEINRMLDQSILTSDSLVWSQGFEEWMPIRKTIFNKPSQTPPPLTGGAVNNTLVWITAFVPILGLGLQYVIASVLNGNPDNLWFVSWVLNTLICIMDGRVLSHAGIDTSKFGSWAGLVPVYLYKRARALSQSLGYFATWMVCFVVSILALLAINILGSPDVANPSDKQTTSETSSNSVDSNANESLDKNIQEVKDSSISLDPTVQVGAALEGSAYLKNIKWSSFETQQGRVVVEASAEVNRDAYKGVGIDFSQLQQTEPSQVQMIALEYAGKQTNDIKVLYKIQFQLSKVDNTAAVGYSGYIFEITDKATGKTSSDELKDDEDLSDVKAIFSNQPDTKVATILGFPDFAKQSSGTSNAPPGPQ